VLDDELAVLGKSLYKKCPGDVELKSGSVAGCSTMVKVFGKSQRLFDKLALSDTFSRSEKSDAARISLEN
jgi:hypothetical protein